MLQNREVGGATMGAGHASTETEHGGTDGVHGSANAGILYGPWGYLNFAAAVVLFSAYLGLVSSGLDGHWGWTSFLLVVSLGALGMLTRKFGMASVRRYARGPRDARIRTQQIAPFVVVGLLLIGLVGHITGAAALPFVTIALAIGATAGLAPMFLLKPAVSPDRVEDSATH